ncbi:hypothetical protein K504DRAFT_495265 [Pleomassaria siparia CBS 279.74]|uniref:Rhodopsin domain-containing protein n=1 Tax=Pleomassaria siparia CBS 279.74 TaxID=1314801 RepID=A0A6G1JV36_9PLEO|nr:hypothetical protein K504DRAFT_495265 [Pleomassaria siparia CBS 279.74]
MNASSQPRGFPGVLPPPHGVTADVNFTQSRWNLITQICCIVGTTLFIFLRCYAKYIVSLEFYLDDWVSIGAWVFSVTYCALSLACGPLGIGIHAWHITPDRFLRLFRIGYVIEVLYGPAAFVTKLAILLLFIRVFHIKKRFVVVVKIIMGILTLYYIAITAVKIFICNPVEKFWNHPIPGTCLNSNLIFISDCIVALITDCVILVAPMPVIWTLQMNTKQKLGSSFALAVGAIACVASIVRLKDSVETKDNLDKSYIFEPILLYSSGEIAIGVICGCIPVIPSLYRYYHKKFTAVSVLDKSSQGQSSNSYNGMVPLQDYSSREYINVP